MGMPGIRERFLERRVSSETVPPPACRPARGGLRLVRRVAVALALLALLAALWRWGPTLLSWAARFQDRAWVEAVIRRCGGWAPLASIGLNVLQVLLAPIPGQVFAPLNGYLFGPAWGIFYSIVGVQLGSMLAMGLSRAFGRRLAERLTGAESLARWDRLTRRWGLPVIFLVFLLPFLPDDVMCFAAGLTDIPLRRLFVLTLIARLPGVATAVLVGDRVLRLPLEALLALGAGLLVAAWLIQRHHRRIQAWFLWRFRRYLRRQ